jgi:hypothetical protein
VIQVGDAFKVDSERTKENYKAFVDRLWSEGNKYMTFPAPRMGPDRSLDQNALFHVWLTEYIANLLGINKKGVTKDQLAGIKQTVKKLYYQESQAPWMVHVITDYSTGKRKKAYTSSGDWKTGEMFDVLNFLQRIASEGGCILESKGQHAKLTREQNK